MNVTSKSQSILLILSGCLLQSSALSVSSSMQWLSKATTTIGGGQRESGRQLLSTSTTQQTRILENIDPLIDSIIDDCGLSELETTINSLMDIGASTAAASSGGTTAAATDDVLPMDDIMTVGLTLMDQIQQAARNSCDESSKVVFEQSMNEFATCSGVDLFHLVEYLPSAIIGTEMECILDYLAENDVMQLIINGGGTDASAMNLPSGCINSILGDNPLGNLIRQIAIKPSQLAGCFDNLYSTLPSCVYHTWPVPIVGSWLKPFACVASNMDRLYDVAVCESLLTEFDMMELDCSLWQSLPEPMDAMPLADVCITSFTAKGREDVIEDFEKNRQQCGTSPSKAIWEIQPTVNDKPNGPSNVIVAAEEHQQQQQSTSTESKAGGSGAGMFFGGLTVGGLIAGGLAFMLHKKNNPEGRFSRPVEQSEIEVMGGNYA